MGKIYVITEGEHDDYGMVSAWSSKEEADRECSLLNGGMLYDACRVEELSLGVSAADEGYGVVRGFKAVYDFIAHGMNITEDKIVFTEALLSPSVSRGPLFGKSYVAVCGPSREECLRILFNAVAEKNSSD